VSIFNYLSIKSLQFCSLADFFIIWFQFGSLQTVVTP
jgi:hypothetical protein